MAKQFLSTEVREFVRIGDKVRVRPRGKRGIYVAEFWHNGKHQRRSLKTSRLDLARQRAVQIEAQLATGGPITAPAKPTVPTAYPLRASVQEYLDAKDAEGAKPKTCVKYRQWLLDSFVPFLEVHQMTNLDQVTPAMFDLYRNDRKRTQSEKSLYTGLTIVKQFFKWCSGGGRDYLSKNPLCRCKVKKPYTQPKFAPTPEQVNAILDAVVGERKKQIALAAFVGLRAQEIQMLAVRSIDLDAGWVRVVARDGWTPKTRQARKVPIHPRLAAMLGERTGEAAGGNGRPYFFCAPPSRRYPQGGHHMNVKELNEDLQKIAKKLGIPTGRKNDGLTLHALRHYFETQCVDSGVPQFVVDSWMGHVGQASMGRLYYGLTDKKNLSYIQSVKF
ncbi:MAG: site-specific tyrosine recombinase XerD [Phycisphaerales bacterium]|nr:site-specific tyrosine recombinase XerD [Phycisphaerales bacterium]